MPLVLLGGALSLLLIACANVASLEVASTLGRARAYAIQIAIGASRPALARTAMLEGACLVTAAAAGAALLAPWKPARRAANVDPTLLLRG